MPVIWSNYPATSSTRIKIVHIVEIRAAINTARAEAGLAPITWVDPGITTSTPIRASHFVQARAAIQDLWTHYRQGFIQQWSAGSPPSPDRTVRATDVNDLRYWMNLTDPPTLAGATWVDNSRPWITRNKTGTDVWHVYMHPPAPPAGGSADNFANVRDNISMSRQSTPKQNVLLRVDYAEGQSLPWNATTRGEYLGFLQQICADPIFRENLLGFIIGNECNSQDENRQSGGTMNPDEWARTYNGYGSGASATDNAFQVIRAALPDARVLVGAVAPYNPQADGSPAFAIPVPWLNYFNQLCLRVTQRMTQAGLSAPDGFALHAYGRVGDDGTANGGSQEPHRSVPSPVPYPASAEYGFRVYRQWLAVMDGYPLLQLAPVWITETNTFTTTHCDQSYPMNPPGWYFEAVKEIYDFNHDPFVSVQNRIKSVCWFVDRNFDGNWGLDAISGHTMGRLGAASNDFNSVLNHPDY
ncbi:MAG: hypothetical protein ACKVVP_15275 [Chloroflexota bacterium]